MAESNEVKEGFICPICMKDLGTPIVLQSHFEEAHSSEEDPAMVHNIKGMFDKAKRKIMRKPEDGTQGGQAMAWEKREQTQLTVAEEEFDFSYWEPQELGFCRNLTREFRKSRSQTIVNDEIIEINKLLIRLEKILKVRGDAKDSRLSGNSSKKAKERSLVPWILDSDAKLCIGCKKSFTVARRKHHCRLCGQVICGKCSEFLALTFAATLCKMNEFHEIGSEDCQAVTNEQDGFRICSTCYESLSRHHVLKKEEQTKIPLVQLYERMTMLMVDADILLPDFNKMAESLSIGNNRYPYTEVVNARMKLLKIYETLELLNKKVIALGSSQGMQSQKLHKGIHVFVINYLQRNMLTLKSIPSEDEFAALEAERSQLLSRRAKREQEQQEKAMKERAKMHKEVLRKERDSMDSSPVVRRRQVGVDGQELRNSLALHERDPLLEQINNVKEFIHKAKENGAFEEIRVLERNLNELQTEYNRSRTKR